MRGVPAQRYYGKIKLLWNFEARYEEMKQRVLELMQGIAKLDVSLVVDVGVGANWDQAH